MLLLVLQLSMNPMARIYDPMYALVGSVTMTNPIHLSENLACTSPYPIPPAPNLNQQKPTNRKLQTGMKMDDDNMQMEVETTEHNPKSGMHAMTTRSSAHLLDKLQKLKETPSRVPTDQAMECDIEEAKKRTQTITAE